MESIKRWFTQPIIVCALVAVALVGLVFSPGFGPFIAGGALMKALTAIVAGFVLMALVWIARNMRVLFNDGKPNGISKDPVAKAILLAGLYIAFALVVASAFG